MAQSGGSVLLSATKKRSPLTRKLRRSGICNHGHHELLLGRPLLRLSHLGLRPVDLARWILSDPELYLHYAEAGFELGEYNSYWDQYGAP